MDTDHPAPTLPDSIVERATATLVEHEFDHHAHGRGRHELRCTCGLRVDLMEDESGRILTTIEAAEARHRVEVALTAALKDCEVEEGVRIVWPDGQVTVEWDGPFEVGRARRTIAAHLDRTWEPGSGLPHLHRTVDVVLVSRYVITTNPEEVPDGSA